MSTNVTNRDGTIHAVSEELAVGIRRARREADAALARLGGLGVTVRGRAGVNGTGTEVVGVVTRWVNEFWVEITVADGRRYIANPSVCEVAP